MSALSPMVRIEMIQRSIRCFWVGLFSLLPLVGIPLAVLSLADYLRIRRDRGDGWNPGAYFSYSGALLAGFSLFLHIVIVGVISINIYLGN